MKREVYRSFEGKLGVDNRDGYIVYESDNYITVERLSVYNDAIETCTRIPKTAVTCPLSDGAALAELEDAVDCGRINGQVRYRGKWYSPRSIMDKYQDANWRAHC